MTYKLIDLFCGAGGMSLGFVDERFGGGFVPTFALDNDSAAVHTHRINFSGEASCANSEDWSRGEVPGADVVVGGPPCQGFSLLNKTRTSDARRALWEPYLDAVEASGARIFVMENVAQLYRSPELQDIEERAAVLGFDTAVAVLNTADYGVPQTRRRTIIIGWDRERVPNGVGLPQRTHCDPNDTLGLASGLLPWRTVKHALAGLPDETVGTEIGKSSPLNLHFGRNPTPLSQKRYRVVPPGGNRFDLQKNAPDLTPACWIRKKSGGTDLFGRLWWDRPSVTIRTEFFKPEKGRYLHPEQHRPISHREAARLMSFPDDFQFAGTKVEVARQIGNAVPPIFASHLARMVKAALDLADADVLPAQKVHAVA